MSEINLKDVSLYELALSCEQLTHPLQVSPTIFKSILGTVVDFLIDEQLPATLWMKLPRGALWQAEVDRLCQSVSAPCTVYRLRNVQNGGAESAAPGHPGSGDGDFDAEAGIDPEGEADDAESNAPLTSGFGRSDALLDDLTVMPMPIGIGTEIVLSLSPQSQLRREYFILLQTAEVSLLMLAHRPRTVRSSPKRAGELTVGQGAPGLHPNPTLIGNNAELASARKHPLLSLCSFQGNTVRQVLAGIRQAIALGHQQGDRSAEAERILQQWEELAQPIVEVPNLDLVNNLFNRQVQRQEEIWRSNTSARQKASAVTELQLAHEELVNANRLKDEFLQTVGQQLRTPLSSMKTALTLLNSPNLKPPQRQRYMELLTKECDRQSSLITGVLDLLQLEHAAENVPMQPLRLVDVVPAVVSTYQPLAQEKGVMLAYTIPDSLPAVSCVSAWLRQIVINLLHNGIKFTPAGGRVWVTASQQGEYVQIEFRDTGIGIPSAEIPKIFERFYKARQMSDEDASGAGLGLSIVQQLLLNCGGSVSVKSKVGEGSSFNVLLPMYSQP
jgi:two-component system phosphate regulon sensor histidine kinase PhoR